jgi:hypothetical protein
MWLAHAVEYRSGKGAVWAGASALDEPNKVYVFVCVFEGLKIVILNWFLDIKT